MHVLIAGAAPEAEGEGFYRSLLARSEHVIAADAAAEWCVSLGRTPDLAVGDFDSASAGATDRLRAAGVEVVTFPAAKDESDLDLAQRIARERGATRVTFTAVTSQRLDHTLAALGTAVSAADLHASIEEPSLAAWVLAPEGRQRLGLRGPRGALVSVFAVGGSAEGVTLRGLRFALDGAMLSPLESRGLSNELAADAASISVERGRLLVVAIGPGSVRALAAD